MNIADAGRHADLRYSADDIVFGSSPFCVGDFDSFSLRMGLIPDPEGGRT